MSKNPAPPVNQPPSPGNPGNSGPAEGPGQIQIDVGESPQRATGKKSGLSPKIIILIVGLVLVIPCFGGCLFGFFRFGIGAIMSVSDTVSEINDVAKEAEEAAEKERKELEQRRKKEQNKKNSTRPKQRETIDSFDDAFAKLQTNDRDEQLRGLDWLRQNRLTDAQIEKVVNRTAFLLDHSGDGNVLRNCFYFVEKHGGVEHVPVVVRAFDKKEIREEDVIEWLAGYNDPAVVKLLVQRLDRPFGDGKQAEEALIEFGESVSDQILPLFNSERGTEKGRVRRIVDRIGLPMDRVAAQCLKDLQSASSRVCESSIRWFTDNPPADDVKKDDIAKELAEIVTTERLDRHRQAAEALLKWGTPKSCQAVSHALEKRFVDKSKACDFLIANASPEAGPGLAILLEDYRLGPKAQDALKQLGEPGQTAILPFINHTHSNCRKRSRELTEHFKTPASLIAAQCLKDLQQSEKMTKHYAMETLGQVDPDDKTQTELIAVLDRELTEALSGNDQRRIEVAGKAFCRWASENEAKQIDLLISNPNTQVYTAALRKQLIIDRAKGQRNLNRLFADGGKRRQLIEMLSNLDPEMEVVIFPLLSINDENAIFDALTILKKIGTQKSVRHISRIGRRAKSANRTRIFNEAEAALQAIRAREK